MNSLIAVISDDILFGEFLEKGIPAGIQIIRLNEPGEINQYPLCNSFFDLAFEPTYERLQTFEALFPRPVFINCMHLTNKDLNEIAGYSPGLPGPGNIVRINAWPTFLKRNILEIATAGIDIKEVFKLLNWLFEIVPDEPGFITARVVAMIINEAYFALGEKVSSRHEIDTAMKLGTNYPYGPFEWIELIGVKKVYELLVSLSQKNPRYEPAPLLKKEALA